MLSAVLGGIASGLAGGLLGGGGPDEIEQRIEPWAGIIPYLTGLRSNSYFTGGIPNTWGPWWDWMGAAQRGEEGSWLQPPPPMVPQDPRITGENVYRPGALPPETPAGPEAPAMSAEELDRLYATLDLQAMAAGNGMSLPSQMAGYQWGNNPYAQGMGGALANLQGITGVPQALGVSGINPG